MRYTITDEMPPELHNLIGRKVTHAGIYRGQDKNSVTVCVLTVCENSIPTTIPDEQRGSRVRGRRAASLATTSGKTLLLFLLVLLQPGESTWTPGSSRLPPSNGDETWHGEDLPHLALRS